MSWTIILGVFVGTFAARAVGPMMLRGRLMPAHVERGLVAVAVSLLAALVAVGTLTNGTGLAFDARIGGLAAAAIAVALRAPFVIVIAVAAASAALLRLAGIG